MGGDRMGGVAKDLFKILNMPLLLRFLHLFQQSR